MDIAGPEDERPGDEVEGIRYFDFSAPRPPSADAAAPDPFAQGGLPESHESATPDASPRDTEGSPTRGREQEAVPTDPFEFALTGPPSEHPTPRRRRDRLGLDPLGREPIEPAAEPRAEPAAGSANEPPPLVRFFELASLFEPSDAEAASRERFAAAFDAARAEPGQGFLAIALRMSPHVPASVHFPIVADGIRAALHPGDALLSDDDRLRLVAVLRGRQAADAHTVFARLKDHLRAWVDEADDVLRAISALAAPDGRPFDDAVAFLASAFDAG
jgi:hypothetical protein